MVLIYFNSFSFHCVMVMNNKIHQSFKLWNWMNEMFLYRYVYVDIRSIMVYIYKLKKYAKKCRMFFLKNQFETLWFSSVELSSTSDTKSEIFLFASPWRTKNGSCRSCGYAARSLTSFFNLKIVRYLQSKLISVY